MIEGYPRPALATLLMLANWLGEELEEKKRMTDAEVMGAVRLKALAIADAAEDNRPGYVRELCREVISLLRWHSEAVRVAEAADDVGEETNG